jgi:hypothetical protein
MTSLRFVVLATLPFVGAACDDANGPPRSYAAALCDPACASDNDCPTSDSCTIRRCDTSSGACYTAGVRNQGTLCNTNHWCKSDGTCGGLQEGESCTQNSDCSGFCQANICRTDPGQGSICSNDAQCVAQGDTCLGTWKCVGIFTHTCAIDWTTPTPDGQPCTLSGIAGTCVADPSGRTHCRLPNGTSLYFAATCQSGYAIPAASGGWRCAAVADCAACSAVDDAGASCVALADNTTCGTSDCQCGGRNDYRCTQGACQAAAGTCPGNYVCSGNACGSTCNGDADCDAHSKCNTNTHACLLRTGETCGAGADCYSGYCPSSTCGCASTDDCPANNTCNTTTHLCLLNYGQSCNSGTQCYSSYCVGSSCGCASTSDCAANNVCNTTSHTCLLDNGQVCTSPSQCNSGYCIPGVGSVNRCSALASCTHGKVINVTGTACVHP